MSDVDNYLKHLKIQKEIDKLQKCINGLKDIHITFFEIVKHGDINNVSNIRITIETDIMKEKKDEANG